MRWVKYWINRGLERLRGWRTLVFNTIAGLLPVLQLTEVAAVMPDKWLPWYALTVALSNMWLRAVTTTPIGQKKP